MKTTMLTLGLALVLAAAAQAQVPQGLGAADPSQQLKSMGMDPTQPGYTMGAPVAMENREPLITVIDSAPRAQRVETRTRVRTKARARLKRRADRVRIIDER